MTDRWMYRIRRRAVPIVVSALVVVSVAVLVVLASRVYRPDTQVDARAAESAKRAASDGAAALLSYAPETVPQDLAAAKTHLTGDFLTYYTDFTGQFVEPSTLQKRVKNTATVERAAVSELHPDMAKVLVFINQSTTTKDRPQPAVTASSVVVTLSKVDGKWLISDFDPTPA